MYFSHVDFFLMNNEKQAHKLCPCYTIILPGLLKQKGSLKEPLSFIKTILQKECVDFNTPYFVEEYSGLH